MSDKAPCVLILSFDRPEEARQFVHERIAAGEPLYHINHPGCVETFIDTPDDWPFPVARFMSAGEFIAKMSPGCHHPQEKPMGILDRLLGRTAEPAPVAPPPPAPHYVLPISPAVVAATKARMKAADDLAKAKAVYEADHTLPVRYLQPFQGALDRASEAENMAKKADEAKRNAAPPELREARRRIKTDWTAAVTRDGRLRREVAALDKESMPRVQAEVAERQGALKGNWSDRATIDQLKAELEKAEMQLRVLERDRAELIDQITEGVEECQTLADQLREIDEHILCGGELVPA